MNTQELDHPNREQLAAFGLGKLSTEQIAVIEGHLSECDRCCETLSLLQEDTFVALIRSAQSADNDDPLGMEDRSTETDAMSDLITDRPLANHPRYRVLEQVGTGGMGDVYKAEHRMMQRCVALKVIKPQFVKHPAAVHRFRREVQVAAGLNHPNIVTAYDAEQVGDVHLLVMEYVEGTNLGAAVEDGGPLSVPEACEYVRQAALGLQHAFERGMVHRDIKPQNLMVTPQGQVKILDFGLAHLAAQHASAGSLTQHGTVMGTPDYVAPEQARDAASADIRSDIYSLGCTLYFLLTGQTPFPAGSAVEKAVAHVEQQPEPVDRFRNDVPVELAAVLARMIAKDPQDRSQTPAQVAEALQPFTAAARANEVTDTVAARRVPAQQLRAAVPSDGLRRFRLSRVVGILACAVAGLALAAIVTIVTDTGRFEIQSDFDNVQVVISQGGEQFKVIDVENGSTVRKLPSGAYEVALKGRSDLKLDKDGFTLTRGGRVVAKVVRRSKGPAVPSVTRIKSFTESDKLITQDGVTSEEGGWRIDATQARTMRLFEVQDPGIEDCILTYRAKLKTEAVQGKAYLEMWCRLPGLGESFSKGLYHAVSGTTDWASYETPFRLEKGQRPDLIKLNLVAEGKGRVWIKDIELLTSPLPKLFTTDFENRKGVIETVTPMLEKSGEWRVSGYFVKGSVSGGKGDDE